MMHRVPRPGLTTLAVAGRGLNEGLGLAEGKPASVKLPRTRRALPAPRCRRFDVQGLAADPAEARRSMLREPYSAAAAPDWLLGMALCALPDVRALEWLAFWPGACAVRDRLPTPTDRFVWAVLASLRKDADLWPGRIVSGAPGSRDDLGVFDLMEKKDDLDVREGRESCKRVRRQSVH